MVRELELIPLFQPTVKYTVPALAGVVTKTSAHTAYIPVKGGAIGNTLVVGIELDPPSTFTAKGDSTKAIDLPRSVNQHHVDYHRSTSIVKNSDALELITGFKVGGGD